MLCKLRALFVINGDVYHDFLKCIFMLCFWFRKVRFPKGGHRTRGQPLINVGCVIVVILLMYHVCDTDKNSIKETVNTSEKVIQKENIKNSNILDAKNTVGVRNETKNIKNMKYILQWITTPYTLETVPFSCMSKGRSVFIRENCRFKNCFITSDRNYLTHYTKFDAIVFHGPEVIRMNNQQLPSLRDPHQKYVFISIESPDYYPICSARFNNYFNWVWTHRLGSDSEWSYIIVRDKKGKVIGPKKEMHWMKSEEMKPVPAKLRKKLKRKTKFAVWYVSNCNTVSKREVFIKELNKELKDGKTGYHVDIIGQCGSNICGRENASYCDKMIERDYFFYMAFENSFSEDYVTEKVLHALEYKTLPVVYGGANYSRFMPDGIYLNARELGVKQLASKMVELRNDFNKYLNYFRWRSHYVYHHKNARSDTSNFCHICELLNDKKKMADNSVHKNLKDWWNPPKLGRKSSNTSIWKLTDSERRNAAAILQNTTVRPFTFTGSTFKCFYCREYYSNTESLLEHIGKHNPGGEEAILDKYVPKGKRNVQADITDLKCRVCEEKFKSLSEIKEHLEEIHDVEFDKASLGITEYKILKNNDVFTCHLCGNEYPTFNLLNSHMNNHVGKVVCENCGAGFVNQQHLMKHRETHRTERHNCSECDKTFLKKSQLRYHVESVHKQKKVKSRKCQYCEETFKEHYSKMLHLKKAHGVAMTFNCHVCKDVFQTQRALRDHVTKFHTEKHKCEICLKCFGTDFRLKSHLRGHSGERNFVCAICKNAYMHQITLMKHMKSHNQVFKFVCSECGSGFHARKEFGKHLKQWHLGQKGEEDF